ncbi:hypothetical protein S83_012413, partial [Arachis hypogaea]
KLLSVRVDSSPNERVIAAFEKIQQRLWDVRRVQDLVDEAVLALAELECGHGVTRRVALSVWLPFDVEADEAVLVAAEAEVAAHELDPVVDYGRVRGSAGLDEVSMEDDFVHVGVPGHVVVAD